MFWRAFSIVALSLGLTLTASAAATQQHKSHKPKASKPAVQPQPAPVQQQAAPAPEPPPTPEHGPASPPEVTFRNGQLTIVARNSTLGDVLNQVRSRTGASIDMPASPSSDRVVGQFGPGAPRDVMAQLLNGSHFDYVMVGSPSDPSGLKKIVLTAKMNGPLPTPQPNNPPAQAYNPGMQAAPQMEQDQPELPPDEANTDVQPDVPPQAEQEEPQGEQQQPNPNGGPVVKTPEQLLRELQQQQQQQQQNQQPPQ